MHETILIADFEAGKQLGSSAATRGAGSARLRRVRSGHREITTADLERFAAKHPGEKWAFPVIRSKPVAEPPAIASRVMNDLEWIAQNS